MGGDVEKAGGPTSGKDFVVDQHYKIVAKLKGTKGWIIDLHEMVIDGDQFAWVIASKSERRICAASTAARAGSSSTTPSRSTT